MTALPAIDPTTAQPEAAAALAEAKAAFGGTVPNLTRVMANSPTTLRGYLAFYQALSDGRLGGLSYCPASRLPSRPHSWSFFSPARARSLSRPRH